MPQSVRPKASHAGKEGASNDEFNLELVALKQMFNLTLCAEKIIRKPYIPLLTLTQELKVLLEN